MWSSLSGTGSHSPLAPCCKTSQTPFHTQWLYHSHLARRMEVRKSFLCWRRRDLLDISSFVQDAAAAIVDDSFLRCFQSQSSDPWNWNIYLAPLWLIGLVVRYLILFPLR